MATTLGLWPFDGTFEFAQGPEQNTRRARQYIIQVFSVYSVGKRQRCKETTAAFPTYLVINITIRANWECHTKSGLQTCRIPTVPPCHSSEDRVLPAATPIIHHCIAMFHMIACLCNTPIDIKKGQQKFTTTSQTVHIAFGRQKVQHETFPKKRGGVVLPLSFKHRHAPRVIHDTIMNEMMNGMYSRPHSASNWDLDM